MKDMLGAELAVGDLVIKAKGSARFGVKLMLGRVVGFTAARVKVNMTTLTPPHRVKTSNMTGSGLLVLDDKSIANSEAAECLRLHDT